MAVLDQKRELKSAPSHMAVFQPTLLAPLHTVILLTNISPFKTSNLVTEEACHEPILTIVPLSYI